MRAKMLIELAMKNRLPEAWQVENSTALDGHAALAELMNAQSPPPVYGANRLVGHLDGITLNDQDIARFQRQLIDSHCVGGPPWMNAWQVRCVTYAKLATLNAGGSTISRRLYQQILCCATADEFCPRIPVNASYSCGDVIPGAHWADGVINFRGYAQHQSLAMKEGLSLINGCFVHLGQALSLIPRAERLVANSLALSRMFFDLSGGGPLASHWQAIDPNDGQLAAIWRFLGREGELASAERQEPVSVRAAPQVADALLSALRQLTDELDLHLNRPSDNPLMAHTPLAAVSQASFLAPRLTVATAGFIESLMLACWDQVQRAQYLLSGQVEKIPAQAVEADRPLGLIQVPKQMMAKLESLRLNAGRRTFASGGATSEGVEDLWSHGMAANRQLEMALEAAESILALELALLGWCEERFKPNGKVSETLLVGEDNFPAVVARASVHLETALHSGASRLICELLEVERSR